MILYDFSDLKCELFFQLSQLVQHIVYQQYDTYDAILPLRSVLNIIPIHAIASQPKALMATNSTYPTNTFAM